MDPGSALQIRRFVESVHQLQGLDEDWENFDAEGIVLLTQSNHGDSTLQSLRALLDDSHYSVICLTRGWGVSLILVRSWRIPTLGFS